MILPCAIQVFLIKQTVCYIKSNRIIIIKKLLLINSNYEKYPYPVPPLGICFLTNILKDKYEIKIYDALSNLDFNLKENIIDFKPDYIGISIRNIDNLDIIEPKKYIEEINNKIIIPIKQNSNAVLILGGSGFSIFPVEIMKLTNADYGIIGEGEIVFTELLNKLDENDENIKIPGVITKKSNEFIKPLNNMKIEHLEFSDIDLKINFNLYNQRGAYSIQTKRGCYHKCIYCSYPTIEGNIYRLRNPEEIADEIEQVSKRLKINTFEFVDSTFNDPPRHAENICSEIIKKNINVNLRTMGINPENTTKELFELMIKAGFKQIDSTPDTASVEMIKNLKKNFTKKDLIKTAELIKQFNIPTMWFFIFGGPGETRDTINETFDFIDNYINKNDLVLMTVGLRIYPETKLYQIALEEGFINKDKQLLDPIFYITKHLTKDIIFEILNEKAINRVNCITPFESEPSKEMLNEAIKLKKDLNLHEPMFRTLLRIRKKYFDNKELNLKTKTYIKI